MFDERAFRKAVEVVEGKLSRHEYTDYNHGCGMHCVVAKALEELIAKPVWYLQAGEYVAAMESDALNRLWSAAGMSDTTKDQDAGVRKAREYLEATKELADA